MPTRAWIRTASSSAAAPSTARRESMYACRYAAAVEADRASSGSKPAELKQAAEALGTRDVQRQASDGDVAMQIFEDVRMGVLQLERVDCGEGCVRGADGTERGTRAMRVVEERVVEVEENRLDVAH